MRTPMCAAIRAEAAEEEGGRPASRDAADVGMPPRPAGCPGRPGRADPGKPGGRPGRPPGTPPAAWSCISRERSGRCCCCCNWRDVRGGGVIFSDDGVVVCLTAG